MISLYTLLPSSCFSFLAGNKHVDLTTDDGKDFSKLNKAILDYYTNSSSAHLFSSIHSSIQSAVDSLTAVQIHDLILSFTEEYHAHPKFDELFKNLVTDFISKEELSELFSQAECDMSTAKTLANEIIELTNYAPKNLNDEQILSNYQQIRSYIKSYSHHLTTLIFRTTGFSHLFEENTSDYQVIQVSSSNTAIDSLNLLKHYYLLLLTPLAIYKTLEIYVKNRTLTLITTALACMLLPASMWFYFKCLRPTNTRLESISSQSFSNLSRQYKRGCMQLPYNWRDDTKTSSHLNQLINSLPEDRKCLHNTTPIILGEPGCGKTTLINGLTARISSGNVPEYLKDKTVFLVNLSKITSPYHIDQIQNTFAGVEDDVILFLDEFHTLFETYKKEEGSNGMISRIKRLLQPSDPSTALRFITATTQSEYSELITDDPAIVRRLREIHVHEPTEPRVLSMLKMMAEESFDYPYLSDETLQAIYDNAEKLSHKISNPARSIRLLERVIQEGKIQYPAFKHQRDAATKLEGQIASLRVPYPCNTSFVSNSDTLQTKIKKKRKITKQLSSIQDSMDRLNKTINKLYLLRKHIRHLHAKKMDLVYEISTNLHPSVTTRNQFLLLDYCLIPTMEQIFNREKEYLAQALEKVGEESFSIEITPDFVEECADTMLKEEKATEED